MIAEAPTRDLNTGHRVTKPDTAEPGRIRTAVLSGTVGAALVIGIGFIALTMIIWPLDPRIAAGRLAGDAVGILIIVTTLAAIHRAAEDRDRRRTERLHREVAAIQDEFTNLRAHVSALTVSAVADIRREISAALAEPTSQLAAQAARLKAVAEGTALDPNDPALLPGQRRNGHAYVSASVMESRFQALAEGQEKLRALVEQTQSARGNEAVDRLADALLTRVDDRIDARLEDIQALATNETRLNGHGGNVVGWPLTPRT